MRMVSMVEIGKLSDAIIEQFDRVCVCSRRNGLWVGKERGGIHKNRQRGWLPPEIFDEVIRLFHDVRMLDWLHGAVGESFSKDLSKALLRPTHEVLTWVC
jgi:hypothetical protein